METGAFAPQGGTNTTVAQAYRARMVRSVELPSGASFKVRRESLIDFLYSGSIPAPMLNFLTTPRAEEAVLSPEQVKEQAEGMNVLLAHFVLDPKIVSLETAKARFVTQAGREPTPGDDLRHVLSDDELGTWEIDDRDKLALYRDALSSVGLAADAVKPFPAVLGEPAGGDGPAPVGEGVRPEAE